MQDCCKRSFLWNGSPTGQEAKLGELNVYISGEKKDNAVLLCHDALGWKMRNTRLLVCPMISKRVSLRLLRSDVSHQTRPAVCAQLETSFSILNLKSQISETSTETFLNLSAGRSLCKGSWSYSLHS